MRKLIFATASLITACATVFTITYSPPTTTVVETTNTPILAMSLSEPIAIQAPPSLPPPVPEAPQPWWKGCELLGDNRAAGHCMMLRMGWGEDQWPCLDALWTRESGWNHNAINPRSGAGGIPQAYPASKMASKGSDWRHNAITQIDWGLHYIRDATGRGGRIKYGTPCKADAVQRATRSY